MADEKLGALWSKTGSKGDFFTGQLEIDGKKIPIVVFRNDRKEKATQPDWNILQARPREGAPQTAYNPPPSREDLKPTPPPANAIAYPTDDINPDDIPF